MNIKTIQNRIHAGHYLTKPHAVQHALKEGFERKHILEAILNGEIIEEYPEDKRVLISGMTMLEDGTHVYLHVVCEHAQPVILDIITAYIPDVLQWEPPTFQRRKSRKR